MGSPERLDRSKSGSCWITDAESLFEDKTLLADCGMICATKDKLRSEERVVFADTIKMLNDADAWELFTETFQTTRR